MRVLVVVDMQNDFIDGALGTEEARAIVPKVIEKIRNFNGDKIIYTMDTHDEDYLETMEGKKLPVPHCIDRTHGWNLNEQVETEINIARTERGIAELGLYKYTFGSTDLYHDLTRIFYRDTEPGTYFEVEFVGLCTDICVISNVMIAKASIPEAVIKVDASCCAGTSIEAHKNALYAMKQCHIDIVNE